MRGPVHHNLGWHMANIVPNMEILCKGVALGADDGSLIEIIAIPRINGKMMELVLLQSTRSSSADIFLLVLVRDL